MKDQKQALVTAGIIAALLSPQYSLAGSGILDALDVQSVRTSVDLSIPSADDNWDTGVGFTGQLILNPTELSPNYRVGLSFGLSSWDANDDSVTLASGNAASGQLSGDAMIYELGFSLLRDKSLSDKCLLTFEAGALFQEYSSDVDITYNYTSGATQTQQLDIDNSLLLLVGASWVKPVGEDTKFFVGATYQFDLFDGEASAFGDEIENKAGAIKLKAGLEFDF